MFENTTNTKIFNSISPYRCLGTEFRTSFRYRGTVGTFRGTFLGGQDRTGQDRTGQDISLDIQQKNLTISTPRTGVYQKIPFGLKSHRVPAKRLVLLWDLKSG